MITSTVEYKGNLRTEAIHLESGTKIITDAPKDNHGNGESFSPTDLMATSLSSCMLSIMGIVAKRDNIDIVGIKTEVTKIMYSEPRRVGEIHVKLMMPKNNYSEKERKLLEHAAHTCPVAKSLHPDIIQKIEFIY
ncbi:MAG: OsmC family protein [Bacteroidetes bacterium]|nr:OsmC family protein [Bacteroidota bacterium]